jgi:uncharacterized membrane protein YfcA
MFVKPNLPLKGQTPTIVLLLIIVVFVLWYFLSGVLGGLIGTGGCSVMLPVIHFWMGYPAAVAVGTTLFAVIFTAISGGYGHLVRRNVDVRAVLWLAGHSGAWHFGSQTGSSPTCQVFDSLSKRQVPE